MILRNKRTNETTFKYDYDNINETIKSLMSELIQVQFVLIDLLKDKEIKQEDLLEKLKLLEKIKKEIKEIDDFDFRDKLQNVETDYFELVDIDEWNEKTRIANNGI